MPGRCEPGIGGVSADGNHMAWGRTPGVQGPVCDKPRGWRAYPNSESQQTSHQCCSSVSDAGTALMRRLSGCLWRYSTEWSSRTPPLSWISLVAASPLLLSITYEYGMIIIYVYARFPPTLKLRRCAATDLSEKTYDSHSQIANYLLAIYY